jgi:protein-disulfide isomerase
MRSKHGWLIGLVILVLLVAACAPDPGAPTLGDQATAQVAQDMAAVAETPEAAEKEEPIQESPPTPELQVDPDDWHVLGSPDAPVTIVEYSDFQCPFCGRYVAETYPQIVENYVEAGQVRYVFRHFPLLSIHPEAQKAAEAAECAGEQGQFWEMHDALFEAQEQWSGNPSAVDQFKQLAGELELDQAQFDACLDGGDYADKVATDMQEGIAQGVTGTPAFRINGIPLSGAQPLAAFQQIIDYALVGGQPPTLAVAADSFRSRGSADAPVVVTEFSDYQ